MYIAEAIDGRVLTASATDIFTDDTVAPQRGVEILVYEDMQGEKLIEPLGLTMQEAHDLVRAIEAAIGG